VTVDFDGERLYWVLDALAKYETPEVLPALVAFIENGGPVPNALADFGEQAVPALLVIETGNDGLAAWSALSIFAKMFTRPSVRHPLSSDSRKKIIGIARARLRDQPKFAVGLPAVRLAVATREPDLIERVKLIATDERLATELAGGEPGRANGLRRFAAQSLKEAGFSTE
jgi:hypothetical protein